MSAAARYDKCNSDEGKTTVQLSDERPKRAACQASPVLWLALLVLVAVCCAVLGGFLGFYISNNNSGDGSGSTLQYVGREEWYRGKEVQELVEVGVIRNVIEQLSRWSKLAGTPESQKAADWVYNFWKGVKGIDEVFKSDYFVPLTLIDKDKFNGLKVVDESTRRVIKQSEGEIELNDGDFVEGLSPAYSAFEIPLNLTGKAILAEDIDLDPKGGFNLTFDELVIFWNRSQWINAHLLRLLRPKVFLTYRVPVSFPNVPAYPNGQGMPDSTMMRSSPLFMLQNPGDPTTPLRPSKKDAYRSGFPYMLYEMRKRRMPIVYRDAVNIIKALDFKRVPGCAKCPRRATGKLVQVLRRTETKIRKVTNVCSMMLGDQEPDRYVIIGGHRDAWSVGAIDPTGGQAIMMAAGKALSDMKKKGWKPRRSLLFCSWDGEETGLYGSMEWIEEEYPKLRGRVVAYINTDVDVIGNWTLRYISSKMVEDTVLKLAGETPDPKNPKISMLDDMEAKGPRFAPLHLDMSSDYFGFHHDLGVPVVDFVYDNNFNYSLYYPLYHTAYETVRAVNFIDPGLICHAGVTRLTASLLMTFADSPILPYNLAKMAAEVSDMAKFIRKGLLAEKKNKVSAPILEKMEAAKDKYVAELRKFDVKLNKLRREETMSALTMRRINDKIMSLEKTFIVRTDEKLRDTTTPRRIHLLKDYRQYNQKLKVPITNTTMFADWLALSYDQARKLLTDGFLGT